MESTTPQTFGVWLRKLRRENRLSQVELSEAASIDQTYVSDLETGKKTPSRKVVERVVKALTHNMEPEDAEMQHNDALLAAGYAPPGMVVTDSRVIYQPILEQLQVASQNGFLDDEALRRIKIQIDLETQEAARRRGALEES